jgi:hypothetical protein
MELHTDTGFGNSKRPRIMRAARLRKRLSIATVTGEEWEFEKILSTVAYQGYPPRNLADVRYMADLVWQDVGLGTALQETTTDYFRA